LGAGNGDFILDMLGGTDETVLDDAIFTALGSTLDATGFVAGRAAAHTDGRFVHDQPAGQLFRDADANGAGAAVLFANLQGAPLLTVTTSRLAAANRRGAAHCL